MFMIPTVPLPSPWNANGGEHDFFSECVIPWTGKVGIHKIPPGDLLLGVLMHSCFKDSNTRGPHKRPRTGKQLSKRGTIDAWAQ